ncbi:probable FUN34 - transmembrane protein involved in ammonia production [Fusarium torulosum]|uniref:Probable FUN34 - transmembrane protein involved in ammonia production n=1 Tax=Fusarium torulosum TaxID=33205 RepID=A0AAE8MIR3_9HYPO|nr:probable FUN34 - transmembrane protein involved in ammonia production [Fusarium torulosum]
MSSEENKLRPTTTAGGHVEDRGQPALPVVHRRFANPSPLGLLSFATGTVPYHNNGLFRVPTPNVMIAVLIFFGGICQYIVGIMEFITGNTFGTAVFMSYGAFNISYSMIYLPGSGIIAAYVDDSGALSPDFQQAIAMYLWAWFILTVIYTIAAVRSSWVLFLDLLALDVCLILLAVGNMVNSTSVLNAGYAFGYLVAIMSYWAGCAGLFAGGVTPFEVPTFPMYKEA